MEIIQFLKTMFIQEFNVNNIGIELLDIVEENKLKDYIYRQFKENIMYGEIFRIFKDSGLISENMLQFILEDMGFDFINIDELSQEETENYF